MNVLETKKAAEDGVVDYDGAALDEEYVYFLRNCRWKNKCTWRNKICGLGAEGSELHLYFVIYVENLLFSHKVIQG